MFQGDASPATGRVVHEEHNGRFKNCPEPDEGGMKPTIEYIFVHLDCCCLNFLSKVYIRLFPCSAE